MFCFRYVVTFELRDQGQHGFALPPKQILPTCKETMDGVISLLTQADKLTDKQSPKTGNGDIIYINRVIWNCVFIKMLI